MDQIVEAAEPDVALDSVEATLNYFLDTGETPFTQTAAAG